jgi:hypothetical protein
MAKRWHLRSIVIAISLHGTATHKPRSFLPARRLGHATGDPGGVQFFVTAEMLKDVLHALERMFGHRAFVTCPLSFARPAKPTSYRRGR